MILHNRISETSYNVTLQIAPEAYEVIYGRQVETYPKTPQGLAHAVEEYLNCVAHAEDLEGR